MLSKKSLTSQIFSLTLSLILLISPTKSKSSTEKRPLPLCLCSSFWEWFLGWWLYAFCDLSNFLRECTKCISCLTLIAYTITTRTSNTAIILTLFLMLVVLGSFEIWKPYLARNIMSDQTAENKKEVLANMAKCYSLNMCLCWLFSSCWWYFKPSPKRTVIVTNIIAIKPKPHENFLKMFCIC